MTKKLAIIATLLTVSFIWLTAIMPKGEPQYIVPMIGLMSAVLLTVSSLIDN